MINAIFLSFVLLAPVLISSALIFSEADAEYEIVRSIGSEEEEGERGTKTGKNHSNIFTPDSFDYCLELRDHERQKLIVCFMDRAFIAFNPEVITPPPQQV